ncbi:MAG: 1-(5-phosphoribosyl)-5-amino-4-imidazole-carboxylate carboxylase, partial [Oscillospiraceae bacterium]
MEKIEIKELLENVAKGRISTEEAMLKLKMEPFEDLGFAKLDNHRALRQGTAEVIYGAGKTPVQIREIAASMYHRGQKTVLITRMSQEAAEYMGEELPFQYYEMGKIGIVGEI